MHQIGEFFGLGGAKVALTHSVREKKTCFCLPTIVFKTERGDNGRIDKRTALKSFPMGFFVLVAFAAQLGLLVLLDIIGKDSLFEVTLGDGPLGIKAVQKTFPRWCFELARFQSDYMSGGLEFIAYACYCLFFFPRSRFFYALAVHMVAWVVGL